MGQERFTGGGMGVCADIIDGCVFVGVCGKGAGLIYQPMQRIITKPKRLYMNSHFPNVAVYIQLTQVCFKLLKYSFAE